MLCINYHAQQGLEIWVELYHSLYDHISEIYGPRNNFAVLELVAGVLMDIKHHDSFLYGGGDEVYSTFSGYLLSPIDSIHPVVG